MNKGIVELFQHIKEDWDNSPVPLSLKARGILKDDSFEVSPLRGVVIK
ncbi:MAG: hypothetical protein LR001_05940 [Clostridiales bacterium]|nr:hypothetical protein [Clostridiales bacterium]